MEEEFEFLRYGCGIICMWSESMWPDGCMHVGEREDVVVSEEEE